MPQNSEHKNEKQDSAAVKKQAATPAEKKRLIVRITLIFVLVVAALALLVWGIYHMAVEYYLGKINYQTNETGLVFETEQFQETVTFEETINVDDILPDDGSSLPLIANNKDLTNFLILATDERYEKTATRTDTMILVSINEKTKKIVLCSLMRDIYAKYPENINHRVAGKWDKLNHAHAYGGANLTMAVLKENFNIDVKHYVKVNFYDFAKIINAMGGLDVPLTSAEVDAINDIASRDDAENEILGTTKEDLLKNVGDGVYHLNGIQAVHHARNRDVGSDWQRTGRQRQILELILEKVSGFSLTKIMGFFEDVLPLVTTNMPKTLLKDLVGNVLNYVKYDRVSCRIPENGLYREEKYNIIVYPENMFRLYENIYGYRASGDPRS